MEVGNQILKSSTLIILSFMLIYFILRYHYHCWFEKVDLFYKPTLNLKLRTMLNNKTSKKLRTMADESFVRENTFKKRSSRPKIDKPTTITSRTIPKIRIHSTKTEHITKEDDDETSRKLAQYQKEYDDRQLAKGRENMKEEDNPVAQAGLEALGGVTLFAKTSDELQKLHPTEE